MSVDVYFKNGQTARVVQGEKVEPGRFPMDPASGLSGDYAVVVKDDRDQVIAHFVTSELVGYSVNPKVSLR